MTAFELWRVRVVRCARKGPTVRVALVVWQVAWTPLLRRYHHEAEAHAKQVGFYYEIYMDHADSNRIDKPHKAGPGIGRC